MSDLFDTLCCPLDALPLSELGAVWRCPQGHCFDVAREGYLNLLPVQNKRSLDPGDSKAMVAARRRFLEAGHYAPIAEAVARHVLGDAGAGRRLVCLDAGCGEGYYLRQLSRYALTRGAAIQGLGLDISKWAVQAAAKQGRGMRWLVGSNAALPLPQASLDRVLCLFGFPVFSEFARVLKPRGELLLVDAGAEHLRALREVIYPSLKVRKADSTAVPDDFELLDEALLRFDFQLQGAAAIADLLAMTPHLYRAPPEGRARAAALAELALGAEVKFKRLRRR